jgi:hypothetical protein
VDRSNDKLSADRAGIKTSPVGTSVDFSITAGAPGAQ